MQTWMFYSYKGGSGRTVAAANVAAALANMGKRVLVMDMDFEAPGLYTLFRVEETDKFRAKRGIQDYLKGNLALNEVKDKLIIDLATEPGLADPFHLPGDACLLYLMASPRTNVVFTGESGLHSKLDELTQYLNMQYALDYIILDAASGIREAFTLSIQACDHIMIFFRWTRQHLEGTRRVVNLIEVMRGVRDGIYRPYQLVASAAPDESELANLDNEVLARALRGAKQSCRSQLEEEFGENAKNLLEVPEIIELKWQESVIVFDRQYTAYEDVARRMIGAGA